MRDYKRHLGRQVVVQVETYSVAGVLAHVGVDVLELEAARFVRAEGSTDMDGLVVVERVNVLWVQVI